MPRLPQRLAGENKGGGGFGWQIFLRIGVSPYYPDKGRDLPVEIGLRLRGHAGDRFAKGSVEYWIQAHIVIVLDIL